MPETLDEYGALNALWKKFPEARPLLRILASALGVRKCRCSGTYNCDPYA